MIAGKPQTLIEVEFADRERIRGALIGIGIGRR